MAWSGLRKSTGRGDRKYLSTKEVLEDDWTTKELLRN